MSHSDRFTDTGMTSVFYEGVNSERERIKKMLEDYFELTFLPSDDNQVEENEEWDRGFQAALALIKGEQR